MEKGSAVYGLGSLYLQFYITQLLLLFNDAYHTKGTHAFDQVFERYLHYQTIRLVKSAWIISSVSGDPSQRRALVESLLNITSEN